MAVQRNVWPVLIGAGVVQTASATMMIDSQESVLFASAAVADGESDPSGMTPVDWTGDPSFNASEGAVDVDTPTTQVTASAAQNNAAAGLLIEGEGQVSSFGASDGSSEVDGDGLSMFELLFTIDDPTPFDLNFTLSTFDVGDSVGEASWSLELVGGSEIASQSIDGNAFVSGEFMTTLETAGQYRFVIQGETDVSGGEDGEAAFSSASGGYTYTVLIPSPGATALGFVAFGLLSRRRR